MNKKTSIIISIIALAILGSFLYYKYGKNSLIGENKNSESKHVPTSHEATDYSHTMGGQIKIVNGNTFTLVGTTLSSKEGSDLYIKKTIEFTITPQTIFKKTLISAPPGTKVGDAFAPQEKEVSGAKSTDLKVGTRVIKIQSNQDLFIVDKAIATEINYAEYDFTTQK